MLMEIMKSLVLRRWWRVGTLSCSCFFQNSLVLTTTWTLSLQTLPSHLTRFMSLQSRVNKAETPHFFKMSYNHVKENETKKWKTCKNVCGITWNIWAYWTINYIKLSGQEVNVCSVGIFPTLKCKMRQQGWKTWPTNCRPTGTKN
jgi:hypothetical protein